MKRRGCRWGKAGLAGLLVALSFLPAAATLLASPAPKSCCRGACACLLKSRGGLSCHTASRQGAPHLCCPKEPASSLEAAVVIPALLPAVPRAERLAPSEELARFRHGLPRDSFHPPSIPPPRSLPLAVA